MVKFLQINLEKSPSAHGLAEKTTMENKTDVILASEPNKQCLKSGEWFFDDTHLAAIKVKDRNIRVYDTGSGKGFVWITIKDIQVFSCYISPNVSLREYMKFLDGIKETLILSQHKKFILGGDMNAKSYAWNSHKEDNKGTALVEWAQELGLEICNKGENPTYTAGNYGSIIDVTMCSRNIYRKIMDWQVSDEETMSHHQYIFFELREENQRIVLNNPTEREWIFDESKEEIYKREIERKIDLSHRNPEYCTKLTQDVCKKTFRIVKKRNGRPSVYWWNDEIATKRKMCHAEKRKMVRINKSVHSTQYEKTEARENYYEKKRKLRNEINNSKKKKWIELCNDLNNNVWGDGYKIVCKRFRLKPLISLTTEEKINIAIELFPQHQKEVWARDVVEKDSIPLFKMEEIVEAFQKIRKKKAPGLDGLRGEVVKPFFEAVPEYCLNMFNDLLVSGTFPKIWKVAKLVLLEKGKKQGLDKMSYRPICLLNVFGKIFEHVLKKRIKEKIKENGDLASNQYGFRDGMSTLDAMEEVVKTAEKAKKEKKICAMTLLDVQNAFNSIPWKGIIDEMKRREIPVYLLNILKSYLEERELIIDDEEEAKMELSCGVPQGSILGPLLWNIYYDPLLRMEIPTSSKIIAYADDIVIITKGTNKMEIEKEINETVAKIISWMKEHMLKIAAHKTEVVLLVSKRVFCREIAIKVDGVEIRSKKSVKYLGVHFEQNMRMGEHIKKAVEKTGRIAGNLARLMPNLNGPENEKRNILASVVYSSLMYGVQIWGKVTQWKKYVTMLEQAQRKVMLRLARAYRTSATISLQVISGSLPIDLMIEEKIRIYNMKKKKKQFESAEETMDIEEEDEETEEKIKEEMMIKWQDKWTKEVSKGQWTKTLIPNIQKWTSRSHGKVCYELSQFLTGHGHFKSFQFKIKKVPNENCRYCPNTKDDPEHTVFQCKNFEKTREDCVRKEGELNKNNIIEKMLSTEESWKNIEEMIKNIINIKEKEDRKQRDIP